MLDVGGVERVLGRAVSEEFSREDPGSIEICLAWVQGDFGGSESWGWASSLLICGLQVHRPPS